MRVLGPGPPLFLFLFPPLPACSDPWAGHRPRDKKTSAPLTCCCAVAEHKLRGWASWCATPSNASTATATGTSGAPCGTATSAASTPAPGAWAIARTPTATLLVLSAASSARSALQPISPTPLPVTLLPSHHLRWSTPCPSARGHWLARAHPAMEVDVCRARLTRSGGHVERTISTASR